MGTFHFMGVGKSVGAVTCAVNYIETALSQIEAGTASANTHRLFSGSGGINHAETQRGKIEALVLFTSKEVIERTLIAFPYQGNDKPGPVRTEIETVLQQVWQHTDPDIGRKLIWCEVDIDNYQDCFEKIIKVTYRYSQPNKQGKEIWCNLTGGSNSLGLALLSMSELTGKSTKRYLISQRKAYQKLIRIPSQIKVNPNADGYFRVLPFIKTTVDALQFYEVLIELDRLNQAIATENLFSRLCHQPQFSGLTSEVFRRQYLLQLYSLGYTHYEPDTDQVKITSEGQRFLDEELQALDQLIHFENILTSSSTNIVAEAKTWEWLHETTL
ncbi:MAG: hypothetical protein F6K04_08655 [Leptolyngbya sp. SIO4C5]|nr:hypothetical protein [Leptolyngbya sp. SIO4C5]